jgi:ribonuclease J
LVIDKDTKEILSGPDIFSRGFIHEETKPEILDEARSIVLETYDRFLAESFELDCADLQIEVRGQLKRFFQRILERRPVIYPIIIDV